MFGLDSITANSITALLLDCDGVTVDSEPLSVVAWERGLATFGYAVDDGVIASFVGRTEGELAAHFSKLIDVHPDRVERAAREAFVESVESDGLTAFADTRRLLEWWADRPVAIASNSPRWRLDAVLRAAGITIRPTIAGDEVALPKPAPDVYRRAVEELGVDAGSALVVEDTPTGVAAGLAAGCRVVAVDRGSVPVEDLAAAHVVVASVWPVT